ncbi:MAG: TolC family protein [Planctomycetota bacterium]|nr:MAG: TolC family protein [Planctomycetota bacterium]
MKFFRPRRLRGVNHGAAAFIDVQLSLVLGITMTQRETRSGSWPRAMALLAGATVCNGCALQYARQTRFPSAGSEGHRVAQTASKQPVHANQETYSSQGSLAHRLHDTKSSSQPESSATVRGGTSVAPVGEGILVAQRVSSGAAPAASEPTEAASEKDSAVQAQQVAWGLSSRLHASADNLALTPAIDFSQTDSGNDPPEDSSAARGTDAGMSRLELEEFETLALESNPAYCEASANVAALRGAWQQAGLPPNLILGYSGQQLGSSGQAEQQGVYIEQEIITGGKLGLDQQVLAWKIRQAQSHLDRVRLSILTDVRTAYVQVLVAQRRRELARRLMESTQQSVQQAEALFRAQEVSRADPLRAQIAAQTATVTYNNSVNQHLAAWRRLISIVGQPDLPLVELHGDVDPAEHDVEWETELARILAESPEVAAAGAALEAARWGVQRARAQVVPDINVQAIVQDDRATGSSNGNLQVSLPVPLWNRNQGGIRQARANVLLAQQRFDRIQLDLQQRLAVEFQTYANARNQVQQFGGPDGILSKSEQSMELLRSGYEAGEFSLIELLTAQQIYIQNHLSYLDALESMAVAAVRIRGMLLHGSLSTDVTALP